MEESGQFDERIGIVDQRIEIIRTPIMQPKMRALTTKELTDLKEQCNRSLDELGKLGVKEVTDDSAKEHQRQRS